MMLERKSVACAQNGARTFFRLLYSRDVAALNDFEDAGTKSVTTLKYFREMERKEKEICYRKQKKWLQTLTL